jgi:hypothetical protein
VIAFAAIMGAEFSRKPYIVQSIRPNENNMYIISERSFVSLVLWAFMTCGRKAIVVKNAAVVPNMRALFMR